MVLVIRVIRIIRVSRLLGNLGLFIRFIRLNRVIRMILLSTWLKLNNPDKPALASDLPGLSSIILINQR
jgi:hypothetical protein